MDRYYEAHPTDVKSAKRFYSSYILSPNLSNPATLTSLPSQFYQQCRAKLQL